MRLLVVEDDAKLVRALQRGLQREGYVVDVAVTGDDGIAQATASEYDAVVLDVMLPGADGFAVCRAMRDAERRTPVLMLTARTEVADRIRGLDAGADDYLVKPFDFGELLARLRALIRRGPSERAPVLRVGDLQFDASARVVTRAGDPVELTAREFAVLELLARNAGPGRPPGAAARARSGARTRRSRPTSSTSTSATCAASSRTRRATGSSGRSAASGSSWSRREPADPRAPHGVVRGRCSARSSSCSGPSSCCACGRTSRTGSTATCGAPRRRSASGYATEGTEEFLDVSDTVLPHARLGRRRARPGRPRAAHLRRSRVEAGRIVPARVARRRARRPDSGR